MSSGLSNCVLVEHNDSFAGEVSWTTPPDGQKVLKSGNPEPFSSSTEDAAMYQPAAEFVYEEIVRQKHKSARIRERARELGEILRAGLTKNDQFRRDLDVCGRVEMMQQISLGSREHGFALRESSWESLDDDLR